MHLENGRIVGDTPEESLVIAEAELVGKEPWIETKYPQQAYWLSPVQYRRGLVDTLESVPREGNKATIRGLSRIAMSQRKLQFVAIDVLTQLADISLQDK